MPLSSAIISFSFDRYCKDEAFARRNAPVLPGIQITEWEPAWALYARRALGYA